MLEMVYKAREAAAAADVDPIELRVNRLAYHRIMQDVKFTRDWTFAQSKPGEIMGMRLVVEHEPLLELSAYEDATAIIEKPEVCVAGIGRKGRWQYFDA